MKNNYDKDNYHCCNKECLKESIGLIAQDIKLIPELHNSVSGQEVNKDGKQTPLSLNYNVTVIDIGKKISFNDKFSDKFFFYKCDVSDYNMVKKVVDKIFMEFKFIDVLIKLQIYELIL